MKTCKRCGTCCKTMIVPGYGYDQEITKLRENFVKVVRFENNDYHIYRSVCKHLGPTGQCRNYANRPEKCRTFPRDELGLWKAVYPQCGMVQE